MKRLFFTNTSDREKELLFSKPNYIFQMILTVRQGEDRIKTLADCRKLDLIDAVLMDDPAEMYYARADKDLEWACEPFNPGCFVIGIRKGGIRTKQMTDAATDTIVNNGTIEQILRRRETGLVFQQLCKRSKEDAVEEARQFLGLAGLAQADERSRYYLERF